MAEDKISGLVNNIKELYIKNDYKIFKDEIRYWINNVSNAIFNQLPINNIWK